MIFIYEVDFWNEDTCLEEKEKGLMNCKGYNYSDAAKALERYYGKENISLMSIFLLDDSPIMLSSDTYNKIMHENDIIL